ncbi:hypothetical protein E1A91_D01G164900v1 [Gossypium mustelinum]|uniref:Uncharacterized protein n=1 Tax=Gossypium mustelinum TaxID=34275 RepID=A0A5D2W7Y4_GOSMU|nr:hypothetical protein E1A91_D01G164900v1 [Gossypium mustelinum]
MLEGLKSKFPFSSPRAGKLEIGMAKCKNKKKEKSIIQIDIVLKAYNLKKKRKD